MVRTIVFLDESDKQWLDQQAALQHVPISDVIRQAVQALRAAYPQSDGDFTALLASTAGTWPHGDGLTWQHNSRDERVQ
ncbi:MAG: hypothetical protein Q7U97_11025 [Rhodocyclaceae bacterium]|nr:hypothetical protein [Rhodocyclaceae bacterium]